MGTPALMSCVSLREAAAVGLLHAEAAAQAERRPGALLQRPDHRAGEEVRDAEVPLPAREEAPGQNAAAQREAGETERFHPPTPLFAAKKRPRGRCASL